MIRSKTLFVGEDWDLVFLLPHAAYKLWTFHYRCEWDDTRMSYPGLDTVLAKTKLNRKALYKARKWLKDHGWLVQTGAAFSGHNPTFRVERGWIPGHGCQEHRASPKEGCIECVPKRGTLKKDTQKRIPFIGDAKVSGSSSVYGSGLDSHSGSTSPSTTLIAGVPTDENPVGKPEPRTVEPKAKARPDRGRGKGKVAGKTAADGTPWPEDFNLWPNNADRLAWLHTHNDVYARIEQDMARDLAEMVEQEEEVQARRPCASSMTTAKQGNPKTENQKPTPVDDGLCVECKERPRRSGTSDYCSPCWSAVVERRAKRKRDKK